MLEQHPVLRERLLAVSTFALIFLGGVAAVDFLVTNGLQWGSDPPRPQVTMQAQSSTTTVARYYSPPAHEPHRARAFATSILAQEPLAGEQAVNAEAEDSCGAMEAWTPDSSTICVTYPVRPLHQGR
jgi:hypothetical protein